MDVKKCDRCGKIFDFGKRDSGERELAIRKYGEAHFQAETFDICADCVKSLKKWIGDKKHG